MKADTDSIGSTRIALLKDAGIDIQKNVINNIPGIPISDSKPFAVEFSLNFEINLFCLF